MNWFFKLFIIFGFCIMLPQVVSYMVENLFLLFSGYLSQILKQLGFVKTSKFLQRVIYFLIFCHELYHFLAFRLCGYSDAEISVNVDRLEGRTSISSFKLAYYKNPRNWAITFVEIPWYKDIFITLAPFLLTAPFYFVVFLVLKYVFCLTKFSFLFWYTVIVLFTFPGKALSESDVKYAFELLKQIIFKT